MVTKFLSNKKIIFVSPWLIGASVGLLTTIVVILAYNNLKREMNLLNVGMYGRGQTLARFVGAGTRASMLHGMQGAVHTQSLIEQASEDPDIRYIAVVDGTGKIMAHSDSSQVGMKIDRPVQQLDLLADKGLWHVVHQTDSKEKIFEVVNHFAPFRQKESFERRTEIKARGLSLSIFEKKYPPLSLPIYDNLRGDRQRGASQRERNMPYDWCSSFVVGMDPHDGLSGKYKILVGLSMEEQERVVRQARLHIFSLSLMLLLVGLGGWFSLLVAHSYTASQKALKNIKAFADLLVLKLPVGIIATTRSGRIETFNRTISNMVGREPEKAVGSSPDEVLPPILASFFDENRPDKEILEQEILLTRDDGRKLNVHASMVPIFDEKGIFAGRVLLVHDLTQLKKLEKEVTKHERLVALGKMAAGVAHEVRNPLSSIKGFATILGSNFVDGSEGQKSVTLLVNEVDRLNRSITELLNYSRPLPLNLSPVSLQEIVRDSLRLMSGDAKELGIETEWVAEDSLPVVNADRDRINQVLLNLYLNAFQAMSEGGRLTVTLRKGDSDETAQICVQDTGAGISAEEISRIVDPYFTTKPEGTGLGLALAHKIIDEHEGSLKFESCEGEGTSVIVELPLRPGKESGEG